MRLSQFGATRGSQPTLTRSAQWAIRSRRKVFLRDISAFVAPQRSPLPLNEIRDHVLAFFALSLTALAPQHSPTYCHGESLSFRLRFGYFRRGLRGSR